MKRKLLLLTSILLLTGCTVNYNLEFDGNQMIETITGTVTDQEITDKDNGTGVNIYNNLLYNDQKVFEDKNDLYIKNITTEDGQIRYNLSYTYLDDYAKSRIINTCFSNHTFTETEQLYDVKLTGTFNCLFSDKVTVNVISNYKVINNNADKVKNNVYTWVIDKEEDVDISITISKEIDYQKEKSFFSPFKIISFIILIILSLITYFLYKKKNSKEV